jgi:hypothetical protein
VKNNFSLRLAMPWKRVTKSTRWCIIIVFAHHDERNEATGSQIVSIGLRLGPLGRAKKQSSLNSHRVSTTANQKKPSW